MEKVDVIEGELIDPPHVIDSKPIGSRIPFQAAEAVDAFADVIGAFAPERGAQMHQKAEQLRVAGAGIERAGVAGGKLMASMKEGAKKLGLDKIQRVERVDFNRGRGR